MEVDKEGQGEEKKELGQSYHHKDGHYNSWTGNDGWDSQDEWAKGSDCGSTGQGGWTSYRPTQKQQGRDYKAPLNPRVNLEVVKKANPNITGSTTDFNDIDTHFFTAHNHDGIKGYINETKAAATVSQTQECKGKKEVDPKKFAS